MSESGYQCGVFTVDVVNRQFLAEGRPVAMEPKVFAVIAELLRQQGRLLTRDDLLDAVWGHRFVTPSTLNRAITLARRAFGDDAGKPRYIQTVHSAGYRFIAPCAALAASPAAPAAAVAAPEPARFGPPFALRLPERLEPLVGRGAELAALCDLVQTHRCVTVLGPGGIGKTRCALEGARQSAPSFPDGVWFFDLSATERAADWLERLASGLGIPAGAPDAILPAIADVLKERRALLVVDNCEQFASELAGSILKVQHATKHLVILATSRRAFDFAGEQRYVLPPLRVPEPVDGASPSIEQIHASEAVELLVKRVRAIRPDFVLDASNAGQMADICRTLDGLPLALELASARFSLLSAGQVLGRLVERFRFLENDSALWPPRHRSLRELLDWSFSLLSPSEQRLLNWSAVFAQSWSIDALIVLAQAQGLNATSAMDLLSGLIAHSLVSVVPGKTPARYRLLETVREYALARLRDTGEEDAARLAHLEAMTQVYQQAHEETRGGRMREHVQQLILDWANIDAAIDTAASRPAGRQAGARLIGALVLLGKSQGNYLGMRLWCQRVLAQPPDGAGADRARAVLTLGLLQFHTFTTTPWMPDALPEAIRLARLGDDAWAQAYAHAYHAMSLANDGARLSEAASNAACAAELATRAGDETLAALACLARAWVHFAHDDPAAALQALSLAPDARDDLHQSHFIEMYRALAYYRLGHSAAAARHWLASIEFVAGLANLRAMAGSIEGCGYLAGARGDLRASARLLGAAEAIRDRTGIPLFRLWSGSQAEARHRLDVGLGVAERQACRDAGRQARPEEVVAETVARLRALAACEEGGGDAGR